MSENIKLYELMILVPGNLSADEAEKTFIEVQHEITSLKGEIADLERWGRRELAYAVAKNDYGYYFVVYAKLPAQETSKIDRFCRINRNIVRYLLLARPEDVAIVNYATVKTRFGGRIKDETEVKAESSETKLVSEKNKPFKKDHAVKPRSTEKATETKAKEAPVEKKPVAAPAVAPKSKKAEKGLDDILKELDKNLEI